MSEPKCYPKDQRQGQTLQKMKLRNKDRHLVNLVVAFLKDFLIFSLEIWRNDERLMSIFFNWVG